VILVAGLGSAAWSFLGFGGPGVTVPPLRIEVLNGSQTPALARTAAERLRGLGHDVVRVGDCPDGPFDESFVVDRRGRDRITRAWAARIGPCPVILEVEEGSVADLTLVLGSDWRTLALFPGGGDASGL
jgi:hypothetical protein